MNKYYFQPVLFNSFSTGNSFLKKIFGLIFFLTSLFSFNTASAQIWKQQTHPVNGSYENVFFLNDNTGWMCAPFTTFIKTTNGGSNWIDYSSSGLVAIYDIYFKNENTGFLAGETFYKTTNGGANWTGTSEVGQFLDIFFLNDLTGWRCRSTTGIEKTTDGGNNWALQFSNLPEFFYGVNFINENTGWICSQTGGVYKTTNSGVNWTSMWYDNSIFLRRIRFTDVNNGTVVDFANSRILKTTNSGANWTNISGNGFRSSYFLNGSTGWIFGNDINFTTNGGDSWTTQYLFNTLEGYFTNNGIGYAGGANRILKYGLPAAPSGLNATRTSTSQINLSWTDNSDDEDKFLIERSPNGATGWAALDSVNGGVTTYQNAGLNSDQAYYYRVYAKKFILKSDYSNTASARTYMNPPALVSPENGAVLSLVNLQWSTVPNGFHYTVQVASDSNFSNLVYQTITSSTSVNPVNIQNSTRYYWRIKVSKFDGSNESQYSNHQSFIYQNPNYGHNMSSGNYLYYFANSTDGANPSPSKPSYNWRDTSGSVDLILNTVAIVAPSAGNRDDGRFDIIGKLPAAKAFRFFGTNYSNFYIGTNGIIAFTPFTPGGAGYYEPSGSLPSSFITNAVFPFWKDLNFADTDVPVNRLCYKITSDELIVTYMRAPNFNSGADGNDYVSFQVIIKHHGILSGVTSKIEVMYNYDQTGSTFKTKYNNNILLPNLIGIQGNNSSSQIFQYRYLNFTPQLISPGPMFGSNLALAIGADVNTLPVELASFTSEVNRNNVQLNWSTAMEENNSGFDVERLEVKQQTSNWSKVGFIQGNGTTNEVKNYSYEDRNVQSGNYKYRLKQIDYNGNFEYHELSGEVIVGVPVKYALSQNYPNPFNPATKINFEIPSNVKGQMSKVKLMVFDITGKLVSELINKELAAGYYAVDFNASNLSSGVYFYRLVTNDFVQTKKMLLIK